MRSRAALLLVLLTAAPFVHAAPPLRFTWAFVYRGSDETTRAIDYASPIMHLRSGDRLRVHLRPLAPCYMYLLLHDSRKDMYLLFPDSLPSAEGAAVEHPLVLPSGDSWFRLDEHRGTEKFYLIASSSRLQALEEAAARTWKDGPGLDSPTRLVPRHPVLDEIRRLIRQASGLAEAAQRPVSVAGEVRGIEEESEVRGVEVETGALYVRTIRVQH
jgi:hypothetical protein